MTKNFIAYENYKRHMEKFGHVATWALWSDKAIEIGAKSVEDNNKERKKIIVAHSEEEYKEKGLDKLLHGDVVIMPLNFSSPATNKDENKLVEVLNTYESPEQAQERYDALIKLVKEDKDYLFYNMYGDAAKNYGPGFMKSDLLRGAYMTDFIKFIEKDGKLLAAGFPKTKSTSPEIAYELNKRLDIHARGLKEEFDLLGIKPKIIVLCHGQLYGDKRRPEVEAAIEKALGYKPHFVKLNHYTPQGSVRKGEFGSEEEAFEKRLIKKLIEEMESILENSDS